mgnify:CR=1 FL=1
MERRATGPLGNRAESAAFDYLIKQGLRPVARNFRCRGGEIDLIMEKKNLLIFVEVRLRLNAGYGSGADSVSLSKHNKIITPSKRYLQTSGHQWESYRFDVISIGKQVDWIPGAFTLD